MSISKKRVLEILGGIIRFISDNPDILEKATQQPRNLTVTQAQNTATNTRTAKRSKGASQ